MADLTHKTCLTCGAQLEKISETGFRCPCCGNTYDIEKQAERHVPVDAIMTANTFREGADFSKAEKMYRLIIQSSPNADLSDVYWGLFLCEQHCFFETDENGERFPSFYDIVSDDISASDNLKNAISQALLNDPNKAMIYQDLSERMKSLKKEYSTIKSTQKPYDIFICFKKSASDGKSVTADYKLAYNIYNHFCREYNVFFSEESLKNIVVRDYEPNIYYALYTAKIMLVLCSDKQYINSKWVKNEWSRYLEMEKTSHAAKSLIPVLINIDPSDLPSELRSHQGVNYDTSLMLNLSEEIKQMVKPVDKNAELSALREEVETLKRQSDKAKEKYVDDSHSRNTIVALADDFFRNGQYRDAKTQYMNCSVKYSNDFYSRYMTALCDVHMSVSESNLNVLSNATMQYIKAASSDEQTSETSIITALSELHRLSKLKLDRAVAALDQHDDLFNEKHDHDWYDYRYQSGKQYFKEYEDEIVPIFNQYRRFIKDLVVFWASANKSKLSAATVKAHLENARKILTYGKKTKSMHVKQYTVKEQKYSLLLDITSSEGGDGYYEKDKIIPEREDVLEVSDSTKKLIKNLNDEISQYQTYVSGIEYYDKGDMMKAFDKLRNITAINVQAILDECTKATAPKRYENAVSLFNQKQYERAKDQFKILGDYRDSKQMYTKSCDCLIEKKYVEAKNLYEQGQYEQAKTEFLILTYGTEEDGEWSGYWNGIKLPENGYKDSAEMLRLSNVAINQQIKEKDRKAKRPWTIAVCVIFGVVAALLIIFGSMPDYLFLHISKSGAISVTVIGILAVIAFFAAAWFFVIDINYIPTIIMAVILVFGLLWFSVAPTALGFHISNAEELQLINNYSSRSVTYTLTDEIDCGGQSIKLNEVYNLNGNGHTIQNINVDAGYFIKTLIDCSNITFKNIKTNTSSYLIHYGSGYLNNIRFEDIVVKSSSKGAIFESLGTSSYSMYSYDLQLSYR